MKNWLKQSLLMALTLLAVGCAVEDRKLEKSLDPEQPRGTFDPQPGGTFDPQPGGKCCGKQPEA